MKVTITTRSEAALASSEWRDAYELEVDGKETFSVYDGEPEDNSLNRNFRAVHKIPNLLKLAHEAGKRGEELTIETLESDEI